MATKIVETNLREEVLAVLKKLKEKFDSVVTSTTRIQEELNDKKIEFDIDELTQVLNYLISSKAISFEYLSPNREDARIDVSLKYPAESKKS